MQILSIFSIFSKYRLLIKLSNHQFAMFKNNLYLWYNVQYFTGIKLRVTSVKGNLKKLWNDIKYWYLSGRVESLILVSLLHHNHFFFNFCRKHSPIWEYTMGPKIYYLVWKPLFAPLNWVPGSTSKQVLNENGLF